MKTQIHKSRELLEQFEPTQVDAVVCRCKSVPPQELRAQRRKLAIIRKRVLHAMQRAHRGDVVLPDQHSSSGKGCWGG